MKWLWILLGIAAIVLLALSSWQRGQKTETTYREVPVTRGDLTASILSTGVVQPENRLEIKPPISGRAEQVLVDEGAVIKKGQILVWMSSTERAAMLDAARARGDAERKNWEEYYKATPVLAPINGTIIQRNVQPGQTFATADAILVMSDRLTIQAQVDETDIAQVRLKQKATVVLDAYPETTIPGFVDRIAYDAKTVNNVTTYVAYILPDKTPPFMRSGMTANVSFVADSKQGALIVPTEGLKKRADGTSYVYVRGAPGASAKPQELQVQSGITDGKRIEIVSGLTEGQKILVPELKSNRAAPPANPFSPFSHRPAGK